MIGNPITGSKGNYIYDYNMYLLISKSPNQVKKQNSSPADLLAARQYGEK